MWMTLTLKYWKPLAIALLVAGLYGYGYLQGMRGVQAEWDKALLKAAQNNLKLNAEVSSEHAKTMADLRRRYDALRLRSAGRLPISNTACGTNATTGASEFSRGMGESVTTLMYDADRNTQQLLSLQKWINNVNK